MRIARTRLDHPAVVVGLVTTIALLATLLVLGTAGAPARAEDGTPAATTTSPTETPTETPTEDPTTDPEPEPEPEPFVPPTGPIRIVTYNTEAGLKVPVAVADFARLLKRKPDIITLQEMASAKKRRQIREQYLDCETCTYDGYLPQPPTPGSTPVIWNSDRFRLLGARTVKVTEPTYVGKRGAGPSTIRSKYINWVRLRDLVTGRAINVLNNHLVPSVQGGKGGPNNNKRRVAIYRKHMEALSALVYRIHQAKVGIVVVTGDFNVNYRKDRVLKPYVFPYRQLGKRGMRASYEFLGLPRMGTHTLKGGNSTRLIDYVYLDNRPKVLTPKKQRIVRNMSSDHRPLLVDIQPTTMNGWVPPWEQTEEPTDGTEEPTDGTGDDGSTPMER